MRGDARGCGGCGDAFLKKSLAKNFLEVFCLRKDSSLNKVLSVYNKTAYFNEKNRRTASPPTVFCGIWGLIAKMKINCHGSTVKKKC